MTVHQVGKMLRGTFYGALFNRAFGFTSPKKRLLVEISYIGRFEVKRPIVDIFIQQTMNSKESEWIVGFSSFSRNMHRINTVTIRFEMAQTDLNHLNGEIMAKSFVHSMTEIHPDVSIINIRIK